MSRLLLFLPLALCASLAAASATDNDLENWVNEGHWPRGPEAVESTPAKQEAKAKRLEGIGDSRQAAEQYKRLAEVYCEADEAEEGLILSARNYLAAGDFTNCRKQVDELRRRFVNPTYLDLIGEVEISLGRGFLEGKGEGGTYPKRLRLNRARQIFQRQFDSDPQGRWAADALFGLGQVAADKGDYAGAIKKFKELLEKYPRSDLRAEAEGNIAVCIQKREPLPDYTESETENALKRIRQAKEDEEDNMDLDVVALEENEKQLADRQAHKRYDQAVFYLKNHHFRAAEVYLELIRDRYPKSPWAEKAATLLQQMRKR